MTQRLRRRRSRPTAPARRGAARGLRFEPLEPRFLLAADFGDAPLPYPTASHEATGPTLGALRDAEAANQPSPNADADGPDDDGVIFGPLRVGQLAATVTVNVQNAPAAAELDAWIDFNADGVFNGAGEQIAANRTVAEGNNVVTFNVPASAADGITFARVRLSSADGLGPQGTAPNGEVEDFAVAIAPPTLAFGTFSTGTIAAPSGGAWRVRAVDLDQDGDLDIVRNGQDVGIAWLENRGADGWTTRYIASGQSANPTIVDLDRDGDLDLLVCSVGQCAWLENNGSQVFTEHVIVNNSAYRVWLAQTGDLDGDGDYDLAISLGSMYGVLVMENNGAQQFTSRGGVGPTDSRDVQLADLDRDGDLDIVTVGHTTFNDGEVFWYRNNGNFSFSGFNVVPAAHQSFPGKIAAAIADLDGDGDLDIAAAGSAGSSSGAVTWYEQKSDHTYVSHQLDTIAAESIVPADIDGDGDLDLLAGNINRSLTLYQNVGGGAFNARGLSASAIYEAAAGDFNGDGAMDVVGAGSSFASQLAYYQNTPLINPDFGDAPASYSTDRLHNGPAHGAGGPQLGPARDADLDGQPTADATGDGADDDGLTFSALRVGSAGTITVNVQNAPAGARLSAWIDFNRDGNFGGVDEMILAAVPVANGDSELIFNVPATASGGVTFARVRIATGAVNSFRGIVADGEVEDYAVAILSPAPATGNLASSHKVPFSPPTTTQAPSIVVADMDGDGDPDVVTAGNGGGAHWHENLGNGVYLYHNLFNVATTNSVRVGDVDRDGDVDIVVDTSGGITRFENDGARSFNYRNTPYANGNAGAFDLADLDSDGDLDLILSRLAGSASLAYALNNGAGAFGSVNLIASPSGMRVTGIHAADIDRDGDLDFAASFRNVSGALAWYENQGMNFIERVIVTGPTAPNFQDVAIVDFDADGDLDLVSLSSTATAGAANWWENDGLQNFTQRAVGPLPVSQGSAFTTDGADRLQVADIDGDGDLDVVAGVQGGGYWMFRRETPTTFTASQLAAATSATNSTPVALADVDGDGTLEVFATNSPSSSFYWLQSTPFGDFDRNGVVNQADRDLYDQTLGQNVATPGAGADGDRSGVVDAPDLAIWEANVGKRTLPQNGPADYDSNETINGGDFLQWQRKLGAAFSSSPNSFDPDNNHFVDAGDLALLRQHFGQGKGIVAGPLNSVPATTPAVQESEAVTVVASSEPAFPPNVILALTAPTITSPRTAFTPQRRSVLTESTHALHDAALATFAPSTASKVGSASSTGDAAPADDSDESLAPTLIDAALTAAL